MAFAWKYPPPDSSVISSSMVCMELRSSLKLSLVCLHPAGTIWRLHAGAFWAHIGAMVERIECLGSSRTDLQDAGDGGSIARMPSCVSESMSGYWLVLGSGQSGEVEM